MHSNPDSTLARQADYNLYIPISQEADTHNIVPTSSSTAQIVAGDAIAMCLMELRGISEHDFATLHPGGNLGKRLTLTVGDIYTDGKPLVSSSTPLQEVIIEMTKHRLGATAVIEDNNIIGIITDGDLRRMLQKQNDLSDITAQHIMSSKPYIIHTESLLVEALSTMRHNKISQLLIADHGSYRGIIHLHDILRTGIV